MANLRDLRTRIVSIKNTKQITNAMKMVSASKLRKSQEAVIKSRPYSEFIDKMLRIIQKKNTGNNHPLLVSPNPNGKTLLIIVTGDRGLCGSFNSSISRYANNYIKENPNSGIDLLCIGSKGHDSFKRRNDVKIMHFFTGFSEGIEIDHILPIRDDLLKIYNSGNYAKVVVIYNEFKSAIQQNLVCKQIIPIIPSESDDVTKTEFIYEPDENQIIDELSLRYINVELWHILLESNAAEQGSRMTAMDNATNNATDLINQLSLQYNRERQAQITTEIIEVASGAEAIQQ